MKCGKVFGDILYVSDHLNGRMVSLNVESGVWDEPIPVPGYRQWFGYQSGGWHFRGKLYMCHSTWMGDTDSLDGEPHHFIATWTVFDPDTHRFSQLEIPTRCGEVSKYLMSDYCVSFEDDLYILAVNAKPPQHAIIFCSKPVGGYDEHMEM